MLCPRQQWTWVVPLCKHFSRLNFPRYFRELYAEYIYYASPNSLVYNNETYIEDMGEEAIEILYPENFDFAEKYDANCYKDLDKSTKEYLNKLWNRLTITS